MHGLQTCTTCAAEPSSATNEGVCLLRGAHSNPRLAGLRQPGQWGSTAEILALTRVLKRTIRVHTDFGVESYGDEQHEMQPLSVHFANSHYRAVTEPSRQLVTQRLRGGRGTCSEAEAAVGEVLDRMHAASARRAPWYGGTGKIAGL